MDDRTRAALERAAAAAERRKKELEGKQLDAKQPEADARQRTESKPAEGTRRVAPPPPATPSPVLALGDPKADDAEAPADAVVEVQPEFDAPLEVAFDDVEPPASRWKVGDTVLAQWSDDHLFYKAVIKSVEAAGTDAEAYTVTFTEYGNEQPHTPVALVVAIPADLASPRVTVASPESSADEQHDEDDDEELRALERDPVSNRVAQDAGGATGTSKTVVGRHADGTPQYLSVEEEARLRALKKKDRKERTDQRKEKVKTALGKLTVKKRRPKDTDAASSPSVVEISQWKKVEPDVSLRVDAPPELPAKPDPKPDAPAKPALSPRRPPPSPPSVHAPVAAPAAAEPLEALPPVVAPPALLDYATVGHLFVALCDLRRLHCDAWIVPTGPDYVPAAYWFLNASAKPRNYTGTGGSGLKYFGKDSRVKRAPGWPDDGRPVPYLVAFDRTGAPSMDEWLLAPLKQCLEVATAELQGVAPARGRFKHLIALPVVGTGATGEDKGEVIKALLPVLLAHARDRNVDVCLTTNDPSIHAALQSARSRFADQFALPGKLLAKADELARSARAGKLALFVGAGVSIGAGLPSWGGLLEQLMHSAGMSDDDRKLMAGLSYLDQANILQRRMGGAAPFAQAIASKLQSPFYGLQHSLLASLNIDSVVSTNYDTLFEDASRDAGKPCAVLPYQPSRDTSRFVLKLHGDVNHVSDIVLTREDYLRYSNSKAALAGIVQSLLITKHFLFVGFSLTDDNFLKVVDGVRQAIGPNPSKKTFGSATFLFENSLFSELWSDIDLISMMKGSSFPAAGNMLDIWLDFLSFRSTANTSFLMEPHFDTLLSPEDAAFKKALVDWMEHFPPDARKSASFSLLKTAMREKFGGLRIAQ